MQVSSMRALHALSRRLAALADACLPATCVVCAGDEPSGLCAACEYDLPGSRARRCIRCGLLVGECSANAKPDASDDHEAHLECGACAAAPPACSRTVVLADYAAPLDRVVHALKFGRDASIARPLGRLLARRADQAIESLPAHLLSTLVVTAVPLARRRLATRGFNQSLEIARTFARARSLPLEHRLLARRRESAPASTLHAQERRAALHGAFDAPVRLDGRAVIVVDDVMTTGATLEAAAEALLRAGAASVINCVVARTPDR